MSTTYDYIILGAGCSGLSLLIRMLECGQLNDKQILLIDREEKRGNDRTWCFWESAAESVKDPTFSSLVFHSYDKLWLRHYTADLPLNIVPYQYRMIRGIDFYAYCFQKIAAAKNVTVLYKEVTAVDATEGVVTAGTENWKGHIIFSSVLTQSPILAANEYYLLQHFLGWWIETKEDFFDPAQADLMNFRTSQSNGCTFLYVLPVTKRRALIEYTLFSESVLEKAEYEKGLRRFVNEELSLADFTITNTEYGVIPMTDMRFPAGEGKIIYIGTAGGQTKASTGYTFRFIQEQSATIVQGLTKKGKTDRPFLESRFRFYDSVLLRVLHERKEAGADVFFRMFKNNKASRILRFLNNDSNLAEELIIMNSTKKSIFLPAALRQLKGAKA